MKNTVNKVVKIGITAITTSLLCASATNADDYEAAQSELQVTPLATSTILTRKAHPLRIVAPSFLAGAYNMPAGTTLRFSLSGLTRHGHDIEIHALQADALKTRIVAAHQASARTEARLDTDQIITAAIPSSEATKTYEVRHSLLTSQPLLGAHRIRFGKIKSGARISKLIRKAATSGAAAVCVNECAALADQLAVGSSNIAMQLKHVSTSINQRIAYRTDEQNHGTIDQWSTPNETLGRGSGDCEDYAILKMAVLAHLGVPINAMEIVVVKDTRRRLFHAVLSVALQDRTVILDNMTDALENDTAKTDYAPLFSLSGTANYIFGYKGGKQNLTASLKNIAAIAPGAGF